jgi:ABC-type multidrug transport system fused ATPase/permease subunit
VTTLLIIFRIIPQDWRRRFYLLILFFFVIGIFEMLGVASIMPFVALMTDRSVLDKSVAGNLFTSVIGKPLNEVSLYKIGLVVLLLFIVSNISSFISIWISTRFAARLNARLAGNLVEGFFKKGFVFLRTKSPANLANYSLREVDRAVAGGVLQLCLILSKSFQVIFVAGLLAFVSPVFSLACVCVLGSFYALFYWGMRQKIVKAGKELMSISGLTSQVAIDLYSSSREILIRSKLQYFVSHLRRLMIACHNADEIARILPLFAKYSIELIAFSLLLAIPIYRSWSGQEYSDLLPIIALYAYAGYRLLPNIQQIYTSISILRFNMPVIELLSETLDTRPTAQMCDVAGVQLNDKLVFKDVNYRYTDASVDALKGISFSIKKGEKIAIVGLSGSGKSTLVDIILGLITPSQGSISVDGVQVAEESVNWKENTIGYAPQTPLLLNATVAENIAFGTELRSVSLERCRLVSRFACISEVIDGLPNKYDTIYGDGGTTFSGGECQRIAIARALYPDPSMLILDEPTSSLDPTLSSTLLTNLCSPHFDKTVIVVTHNWDSLNMFNKILVMDKGEIIAYGGFEDISELIRELRNRQLVEARR